MEISLAIEELTLVVATRGVQATNPATKIKSHAEVPIESNDGGSETRLEAADDALNSVRIRKRRRRI